MPRSTGFTQRDISRRHLLQGIGATGVISIAGCFGLEGGDNGNGNGGGEVTNKLNELEEPDMDFSNLKEGGTLRIGATTNVSSWDPPYSSEAPASQAQNYVFEGLITTDRQGTAYPWLAKSYEQVEVQDIDRTAYEEYMKEVGTTEKGAPKTDAQIIIQHPDDNPAEKDQIRVLTPPEAANAVDDGTFGMQFRYNLRQGITFHNGEELTADNVVQTVKRYENSDVSAQTFDTVLHARKVDKYTVDLYAQVPDAEAERQVPGFSIHSTEQAELEGGKLDPRQGNTPIGTGPYKLDTFEDGQFYELSKNGDYWVEQKGVDSFDWFDGPSEFPDGPVIEKLQVEIIEDDANRSAALQNDEIDVASGIQAKTLDQYLDSDKYTIRGVEAGSYEFMQFPVNVEPWDDKRLRQAVNHLVPRKNIVKNVLSGWARPAWTPVPKLAQEAGTADAEALENELKPANEYDTKKAEELLDTVGEEKGIEYPLETRIEVNSGNADRVQMVELIAESMNKTDYFDVTIKDYEFNKYTKRLLDPEYQNKGFLAVIGLSGTFNPGSFCNALHHSNNIGQCCNLNGISVEELDTMIDNARYGIEAVEDKNVRTERYDEIWNHLSENRYTSFTHFDLNLAVMQNGIKGFKAYPFTEGLYSFALHAPEESQAIWLDK